MQQIDLYASVGYALELLARSEYHRRLAEGPCLAIEILPAMRRQQARFYLTPEGNPDRDGHLGLALGARRA